MLLLAALTTSATAQTVAQSEHAMAYLKQRACIDASVPAYSPATPVGCLSDLDCAAPATCEHRSLIVAPSALYPSLELVAPPLLPGSGEGVLRYVPLCEDGSGDHEHAVSGGVFGAPPTCAPEDYIRCGDGTRPHYRVAPGTTDDWLIDAGTGGLGHAPGVSENPAWHTANFGYPAHYGSGSPAIRGEFDGIYADDPTNPFRVDNRIRIDKCSTDRWTGNRSHEGLSDATSTELVELETGTCFDANGDGVAECADDLVVPGSCPCTSEVIDPPPSPDGTYDVHYHGRRIVEAVLVDVTRGVTAWTDYPLVDAGDGTPLVGPSDVVLPVPDARARFAITCHSMGCNGLYTTIDRYAELLSTLLGGPVDTRAVFNNFFIPGVEVEAAISEWDGVDADGDGLPDTSGVIDDTVTIYDHALDTVTMTGEPLTVQAWLPGGDIAAHKIAWFDDTTGDLPPADASCLAHHCPGLAWTDAACAPCMSSIHTLLNHLQTPFVVHTAQLDTVENGIQQCADDDGLATSCDFQGEVSGVDLADGYYRAAMRKQLADLYRHAPRDRCEAASGPAPYDQVLLLSPDWELHAPLMDDRAAYRTLDPAGPIGPTTEAQAAWTFLRQVPAGAPRRAICMEERYPGENADQFSPAIPGCAGP